MNKKHGYMGDRPYINNNEYLEAHIMELDYILYEHLEKQAQGQQETALLKEWENKLQEVGTLSQTLADLIEENQSRREISAIAGKQFFLEVILEQFEDKNFFRYIFILAFLWNMDNRYQRIFDVITRQNDKAFNIRTCITVFLGDKALEHYSSISNDLWILSIYFPEYKENEKVFLQPVCMDERLADYLTGNDNFCPSGVTVEMGETKNLLLAKEKEWEYLMRIVMQETREDCALIFLVGEHGIGKKQLLKQMIFERQKKLIMYKLESDIEQWEMVYTGIRYAAREAVLQGGFLAIENIEQFTKQQQLEIIEYCREKLSVYIEEIYLLWDSEKLPIKETKSYCIVFHMPTEEERFEIWNYYAKQDIYKAYFDRKYNFRDVANTFIMNIGQIEAAIEDAHRRAKNETVSKKELSDACYAQLEHSLAEKTTKVESDFTLADLKLAKEDKEILRDVCNCIRYRNVVMQQWRFKKVVPYGAGITVLFAGPPGTGKTMAAQVIANELNMELYKVDLSQVIDKYVGETEKNIRQIFIQANKSNSVLFFDEADAIFNKRVEVSGANERFANIESSLLLQCIEEYNGIAVLATNNYTAIDPAFIRRFKYYLLFREPDKQLRYEIWSNIFPKETPFSEEIDFKLLAELFEFTGAVIKNVALSAAYLAASNERGIMLIDILKSIKRELYKNNLILTKEKLGNLGYIYDEL